jgi:two-component system sensor histidine kinase TctE
MTTARGRTPKGGDAPRRLMRALPPHPDITDDGPVADADADAAARFLAEASHELRGGAARLALMAEALATRADDTDRPDTELPSRLHALAAEGRRLQALASALLDIVQLSEQGRRLDPVPVRVAVALAGVLAGERPREGQAVEIRGADDLTVLADPLALDQILSNLVHNAYRHGGRRVTVECWPEGDHVAVAVADDGPGVPAGRAGDLFEPWGPGTGDGLGLRIAAQLVALLGGEIGYEPREPSGARFVVRLPEAAGRAGVPPTAWTF